MSLLNTDIPELKGYDTGLCLSNLDILVMRQDRVSESVLAVLSELADAIIHDAGGDPDTVTSILLSLQSPSDSGADGEVSIPHTASQTAPVNREPVRRMTAHAGLYARLMLYRLVEDRMAATNSVTSGTDRSTSPLPATVRGRIAYMPGAFADKAYLRLSACVKSPRAAATVSFVDACEEVHGGLCEYCILPLENTHNGKLTAFTRLIIRYRLHIAAVCDLENGAVEGQTTRFALLRAAPEGSFPTPLTIPPTDEPLYLEFVHITDTPSLTDLLIAAEFCGLTLCRADTLPRFDELEIDNNSESDGPPGVSCVLNAAGADMITFCRFLSLEAPEDILMGLYGAV